MKIVNMCVKAIAVAVIMLCSVPCFTREYSLINYVECISLLYSLMSYVRSREHSIVMKVLLLDTMFVTKGY